jgi:hypothetical protein
MREDEIEKEIVEACRKIKPEFFKLLQRKHPELIWTFKKRYMYIDEEFSPIIRIHNAFEILRAYILLKGNEKR